MRRTLLLLRYVYFLVSGYMCFNDALLAVHLRGLISLNDVPLMIETLFMVIYISYTESAGVVTRRE